MSGPGPLRTATLVLRPMAAEDVPELHRQWNDPRVARYLWDGQPVPRERVEEVVSSSAATFAAHGFGLWTARLPAGVVAGFAGLRVEKDTGRVELLYAFDPELWGRGLATEAAGAVLQDAFHRLRLPVIYAGTNPQNVASWRVLERLGMQRVESRQTAVEELLIYSLPRSYDPSTP